MMKKLYYAGLFLFLACCYQNATSQICDTITPVFTIDLTGQPSGAWTSPPIQRDGHCCGVTGAPKCIEFVITLDSSANGIRFDIISGAVPPGALFYQVDCGPMVQVGQPICLSGPGPHHLTFCKPGNNTNEYQISSIPKPSVNGTRWVSQACRGQLSVLGLIDTSIHWTSLPFNATYNSYLSCTSGCDSVTVSLSGAGFPAYVDYQVCGYVIGGCVPFYFCDTIRVHFVNDLSVSITPQNPTICFGGTNATVTAVPGGGLAPYHYLWSNGATTQTVLLGPGTFIVQITDSMSCSTASDTVTVTALPSPITANAGTDQLLCTQQTAQLNGSIIAATGGQWFGGTGTFSPNDTTLNAVYTPSVSEVSSGTAHMYLVTTGNSSCPSDTDDVIITISSNPQPSISGNSSVCEYSTSVYTAPFVSGINYTWNVSGGTIISMAVNSITVHWNAAGSGVVTLTEENAATCDSTITMNITIAPQPVPVINGPLSVCTSTSSPYSVTTPVVGDSYSWNVTGGTIVGSANGNSINVQWTSAGNATITVTESNSLGCDSTVIINVTILSMPVPVIVGPSTICSGQTLTYTSGFVSGHIYSWSVVGGSIVSTNNNAVTINWPTTGTGTITLTEANTTTCDSTISLNVIIAPQPVPVINGPVSVCTSTSSQYSISIPIVGDSYSWNVTGGTIVGSATGSSINIQWTNPGNATITVIESNSSGCDSTVIISVAVIPIPVPVINGPTSICQGQTITYSTPFVSGNSYSWNVTLGNVISVNNNLITIQWPMSGNGIITLTEANTTTCDSTITLNVVIGPQPSPAITGPTSSCIVTLSQYYLNNADTANLYTWHVTGGTITGSANADTIVVQWNHSGSGSVSVTASNSFGCDSTVIIPLTIYGTPVPVLSGPPNACEESITTYSVPYVAGHTYSWTVTNGSIVSFTITNTIDVYWSTPGIGEITVNESSPEGCDSLVNMFVRVDPKPAPAIAGPLNICEQEFASYTANPDSGSIYNWSVGGGIMNATSNTNSINVLWNSPGSGFVDLVEISPYGCVNDSYLPVMINQKPHPSIAGSSVGCLSISANVYTTTVDPGTSYQWAVTGGFIVGGTGTNNISVQWTTPGINQITLSAINTSTGCDSMVSIPVLVDSMVPPTIQATGLNGCSPLNLSFSSNTLDPSYHYAWNFGDGNGSSSFNTTHIYNQAGTYPLALVVTNNTGCADTVHTQVTVYNSPVANFFLSYNTDVYYANMSELAITNQSLGANQYFWEFGNGDTSTMFQPSYEYIHPGIYNILLIATNQYGCRDTTLLPIDVRVPEDIYIPNAFTPDGDSNNDYFSVKSQNITDMNVTIFDRWGEEIFSSTDPSFRWDGTSHGRPVQQDVYVYVIKAKGYHGKHFDLAGSVTVLR